MSFTKKTNTKEELETESSLIFEKLSPSQLMGSQRGSFPIAVSFGAVLGFLVSFPDYLNYDTGVVKNIVSVFGGSLKGLGNTRFITYGMMLSFCFFLGSFLHSKIQRLLSFLAGLLLVGTLSLHYENQTGFDHTLILPTQFFLLVCLYHFFWLPRYKLKDLKETKYPNWLKTLPTIFLGIHYFGSGITKVLESGLQWADGFSLMVWLSAWSNPTSFPASLFVHSFHLSLAAQIIILSVEIFSVLFFLHLPKVNAFLALILISFHFFNELFFQYGFWVNIFFLWVVFIQPLIGKTLAKSHLSKF
jgi:hypothetical protein